MPAVPSPLGAARTPPAAGRKPAVPQQNTNVSPLAVAKGNAKSSASKASPGARASASRLAKQRASSTTKQLSSTSQKQSKAGASATSPQTVSDAEVAIDSHAAVLSSAVSPGLCASPYVDVRLSQCDSVAASSMHEDSLHHDQEQVPANMQDWSPKPQGEKLLEGFGCMHAQHATDDQCDTPVQASSVSKVTAPATCASTVYLVPVTDALACGSCMTDADMRGESPTVTPSAVSAARKHPTPQKTQSASPPDNVQEGAPEASPVLPLLGPVVTPVSSVASAVVHDAHAYKDTPPVLPRGAHSTQHAAESGTAAAAPEASPLAVTDLHACVVDACNLVPAEGHGTNKSEQVAADDILDASAPNNVQEMAEDGTNGSLAADGVRFMFRRHSCSLRPSILYHSSFALNLPISYVQHSFLFGILTLYGVTLQSTRPLPMIHCISTRAHF